MTRAPADRTEPSPRGRQLWRAPHPERAAVYEQGTVRWLEFGVGTVQTRVDLAAPHRLLLPYTRALAGALTLMARAPRSALLLGLGGGALAHFLLHHAPQVQIDAVEASSHVIDAARRFFALPAGPQLRIEHGDARRVGARGDTRYELAVLDVFDEHGLPDWVREPVIYRDLRARLTAGGVLAVNLWVDDADEFLGVMSGIREAFEGRVLALAVPGFRNLAVFALGAGPGQLALSELRARARHWSAQSDIDFEAFVTGLASTNLCSETHLLL